MDELKNCPFCGADGVEVWTPAKSAENYSNTYDIWCGNCDEEFTFDVPDKKTLIRCWNTRPIEDKLKAEIERLKAEIREWRRHAQSLKYSKLYECGKITSKKETRKRFEELDLEDVLRANADGMPIFRKCFEHEILLSFYDDDGAYGFRDWWNEEGTFVFNSFMEKRQDEWINRNDKKENNQTCDDCDLNPPLCDSCIGA